MCLLRTVYPVALHCEIYWQCTCSIPGVSVLVHAGRASTEEFHPSTQHRQSEAK